MLGLGRSDGLFFSKHRPLLPYLSILEKDMIYSSFSKYLPTGINQVVDQFKPVRRIC
jgi:hypothetical protein